MDEYLFNRSRENLIDFYNEELCKIYSGENSASVLNKDARKRLKKYGILERERAQRFVLTAIGKKLLYPYYCARR